MKAKTIKTKTGERQSAGSQNRVLSWLVDTLKIQAKEIVDAGHSGWGNTMLAAAEELEHHHKSYFPNRQVRHGLEAGAENATK